MFDFEKAKRISLTTQVEMNLKSALIIGSLEPGVRLITREIAEQLGTSITPVREALLRLASSGALQMTQAQAFMVPETSLRCFNEVNQLRKALESMAISTAAARMNSDHLQTIRRYAAQVSEAIEQGDMPEVLRANCRFYFRLYDLACMPILSSMIEQLWVRNGPCVHYLHSQPCEVLTLKPVYAVLFEALENGDGARCAAVVCHTIDNLATLMSKQFATVG